MENNSRKMFVINNFDSQEAKIFFNFLNKMYEKQERKGAELHMTYLGNLNNTNTNQSKSLLLLLSN